MCQFYLKKVEFFSSNSVFFSKIMVFFDKFQCTACSNHSEHHVGLTLSCSLSFFLFTSSSASPLGILSVATELGPLLMGLLLWVPFPVIESFTFKALDYYYPSTGHGQGLCVRFMHPYKNIR